MKDNKCLCGNYAAYIVNGSEKLCYSCLIDTILTYQPVYAERFVPIDDCKAIQILSNYRGDDDNGMD